MRKPERYPYENAIEDLARDNFDLHWSFESALIYCTLIASEYPHLKAEYDRYARIIGALKAEAAHA